ncbi:MAG: FtsX-like permease family protein, partial [Gemmatimonadales bacterium]
WTALRRQVLELPDVEAAGLVWPLPFADQSPDAPYAATGGESEDWGRYVAAVATASPGYFEAIGATLIDGRTFEVADLDRANAIAVVDEVMAARLYPGESAVGRAVWIQPLGSSEKLAREIVGVIRHIRHNTLAGPEREVLYDLATSPRRMALVVRTGSNPMAALPGLRQAATSLDPDVPLFDTRTLGEYVGDEIAPTRFTMTLASAFAVVALVMAAVGLYGVISYSVTQRAAELGVRVALGAHDGAILRLVLRQGAAMAGLGIAIGLIASFGLTRTIRSLLVGVAPTDAPTLVGVSLLLAAVTLVASYFPARRAARLDPVVALRKE